jgi:hypothetical protein
MLCTLLRQLIKSPEELEAEDRTAQEAVRTEFCFSFPFYYQLIIFVPLTILQEIARTDSTRDT